jgi:hypothetical protein
MKKYGLVIIVLLLAACGDGPNVLDFGISMIFGNTPRPSPTFQTNGKAAIPPIGCC